MPRSSAPSLVRELAAMYACFSWRNDFLFVACSLFFSLFSSLPWFYVAPSLYLCLSPIPDAAAGMMGDNCTSTAGPLIGHFKSSTIRVTLCRVIALTCLSLILSSSLHLSLISTSLSLSLISISISLYFSLSLLIHHTNLKFIDNSTFDLNATLQLSLISLHTSPSSPSFPPNKKHIPMAPPFAPSLSLSLSLSSHLSPN